ncbi:hypothetical protein ABFS83_12G025400 [Erythranthe nasuta]
MAAQLLCMNSSSSIPNSSLICKNADEFVRFPQLIRCSRPHNSVKQSLVRKASSTIQCSEKQTQIQTETPHRTCKNCKTQFDPSLNHPRACRYHTAHYGGETRRKFESVYTGGTMNTPGSGKVVQYWHCCGSEDPFDPGCTAAPHSSYDD